MPSSLITYSLNVNIHVNDEYALNQVCVNNHLKIAL